ncbi:MAG: hypothetical protein K9H49_19700 [Bacteroidales bacterium]|jgi:hypothetical protein|nr:hypothetical protein [Bacteroidales bacterium]MCF8392024.1 hypothetical protein [Bacteroidales bacterium]
MKNIFKLFSLFAVLLVTVVACDDSKDWFSDYSGEGATYAVLASSSISHQVIVDGNDNLLLDKAPAAFPIGFRLIGPAKTSDVTIGFKVDSASTAAPVTFSSNTATIAAGELSGSVMCTIDENFVDVGGAIKVWISLDPATTSGVEVYDNAAYMAELTLTKDESCVFDISIFEGAYYYETIWSYDPTPTGTVGNDGAYQITITDGIWDEMGPVTVNLTVVQPVVEVSVNTYEITGGANQMNVWSGSLTSWGLGADCDFNFEDFTSGSAHSCNAGFKFACTPTIDDNTNAAGYWWGGEFEFIYHKGTPGKKAGFTAVPVGDFVPKLQRR